jgi:hypothetical protein
MIKKAIFYLRALINTILTPTEFRLDYWKSLDRSQQYNSNPLPWMNYKVIQYLEKQISEGFLVFEYGSGASTEYWLRKGCQVTSVEHDSDFFLKMHSRLKERCDYKLIKPEPIKGQFDLSPESGDSFISSESKSLSFERYVKSIDAFAADSLDMVVVDGRARPSCIKRAIPKIKSHGIMILDNSDRGYYLSGTRHLLKGWSEYTFRGTVRGLLHQEQTTIFQKP